jgi:death-on-curing protein
VKEPHFLERATVLQLHRQSLLRFGGSEGIREDGLIDSALGAAMNAYFYGKGDFSDIAATYAFHIAQAQAFLDGNKRTAVSTALVFLEYNGVLKTPSNLELYEAMIAIAEKRLDKAGLAELFRHAAVSAS